MWAWTFAKGESYNSEFRRRVAVEIEVHVTTRIGKRFGFSADAGYHHAPAHIPVSVRSALDLTTIDY